MSNESLASEPIEYEVLNLESRGGGAELIEKARFFSQFFIKPPFLQFRD